MKSFNFSKITFYLSIALILSACPIQSTLAQGTNDAIPNVVNTEIRRINDDVQSHYTKAFSNIDDGEYIKAAEILEGLIRDYGTEQDVQNAFFYLADIYSSRLQGEQYFRAAIRVLELFIQKNPTSNKTLDARLKISLIYYRHLNQPDAAVMTLEKYFDSLSSFNYLESEKLQAQILLAKCYRKSSNFANEAKVWDALAFTNPDADRTGRTRFLRELDNWKRLPGNGVNLYFHTGIAETSYRDALALAQDALAKLVAKFGINMPGPVEVYLYNNMDDLAAYTASEEPLAIDGDGVIHLQVDRLSDIPHLMAMVYSTALNARPKADRHPLMRDGFDNASLTGRAGESIDTLAARQLLLFDKAPKAALFLGTSNFYGSTEYGILAGSFCKYLLDKEPVDAFMKLYRGLYPYHDPDMVEAAFSRLYRKTLDELVGAWYASLNSIIEKVRSEVGSISYNLRTVNVDLSTPEAALETYYQALRNGDYNALMKSTTPELRKVLEDAKKAYEEEGIFKKIVLEQFVYPYYPTTYEVTRSGELGDDIFIFKINIIKDKKILDEKDVQLKKINGKWYVDVTL